MLVSACRDGVERHYPCRDLTPRIAEVLEDDDFEYGFQVGWISFKMTKADLDAYSIKSRGRIHKCEGVILESMDFRVSTDLSKSVDIMSESRVVLLIGGDPNIHNYLRPASEYIKEQEDSNTWKEHEKLVPLGFREDKTVFYCRACEPFFTFPVTFRNFSDDRLEKGLDIEKLESLPNDQPWRFQIRGAIKIHPKAKTTLKYSMVVGSEHINLSDLPDYLVDLEAKINSWIDY